MQSDAVTSNEITVTVIYSARVEAEKQAEEEARQRAEAQRQKAQEEEARRQAEAAAQAKAQQEQAVSSGNAQTPVQAAVYIAASGNGTKYHSDPHCSRMNGVIEMSVEEAQAMGYTPCKKCY